MTGKIIAIEGTDCSGKETQAKLLVERLKKEGYSAVYISFPDYNSPTGKIVGGPYLGKEEICSSWFSEGVKNVDPKIASLYYAADRLYHKAEILDYVSQENVVILDRYVESNMAFQGGKLFEVKQREEMYAWIEKLEYGLLELPKPDEIIFLYMPYEYACMLKKNRSSLDEHEKDASILLNAEKAYLELAEYYCYQKIECVKDGTIRSIEDIHEEIFKRVLKN